MSVRIRGAAVAGIIAATAVALPAAALASGSGSPSATSSPAATKSAAPSSPGREVSKSAAAGANPGAIAASKSAAATSGSSNEPSMTSPAAVAALAGRLGVSIDAARHALQQIVALGSQGAVDPASSAFATIAHGVGVSPAQLAAALAAAKQAIGGI